MPTYQYACTECGHGFEAVQSFNESALTECPACSGKLRKVFSSVGIVFKGSGFYRTDSREKPAGEKPEKSDKPVGDKGEKAAKPKDPAPAGSGSGPAPSSDSKPAAKPASSTTGSAA